MTTTLEAKREGQARSQLSLSPQKVDAFLDVVRAIPAGTDFSVNLLRPRLDALDVPDKARAAVRAGSWEVPVTEPSTGRSARHATVRVYRRTDTS